MPTRDDFFEPDWADHDLGYGAQFWDDEYAVLYDNATSGEAWDDSFAQALFNLAYVDHDESPPDREQYRDMLDEWTEDTYGWVFSEVFDWEAWHDHYYS